ncbi:hypothetical protein ACQZ4U_23550, partial [Agrobacterium vitis]
TLADRITAIHKQQNLVFSYQNVTVIVFYQQDCCKPHQRDAAVHVSLSSIFNCQITDSKKPSKILPPETRKSQKNQALSPI